MKRRFPAPLTAALALTLLLITLRGPTTRAAGTPYRFTLLNVTGSIPCDMSSDGRIVGQFEGSDGRHAFYWEAGTGYFADLTAGATPPQGRAASVNRNGVVLGWSGGTGNPMWLWDRLYGRRPLDSLHSDPNWIIGLNNVFPNSDSYSSTPM